MQITKTQVAMVSAALGLIWMSLARWHSQHGVTPAHNPTLAPSSVASESGDTPREDIRAALENLTRELTLLKKRATLLEAKGELLSDRASVDDTRDRAPSPEEPAPAKQETREEYLKSRQRSFEAEPVDGVWADKNSDGIHAALSQLPGMRSALRSVQCRAQSCKLEFDDTGAEGLSQETPLLARQLGEILPSMDCQQIDMGNGRRSLIVYVSAARAL